MKQRNPMYFPILKQTISCNLHRENSSFFCWFSHRESWKQFLWIYNSRATFDYITHLAVGGKRQGGAKKGIASVHTHFQRVLGVHELQQHHQKLALIRRRRHLIPAITFKITYIIGGHHARRVCVCFLWPTICAILMNTVVERAASTYVCPIIN